MSSSSGVLIWDYDNECPLVNAIAANVDPGQPRAEQFIEPLLVLFRGVQVLAPDL